jgi:hypothetical protein
MTVFEFSTGVIPLHNVVKFPLKIQRKDQVIYTTVFTHYTSVHQSLYSGTVEGQKVIEWVRVTVTLLTSTEEILGLNLNVHIDCLSKFFKIIIHHSSFLSLHSPDTESIVN